MIAVGITGSYASGKSFVLDYLANLGFATFSADRLVQNLYQDLAIQNKILKLIPDLQSFNKALIAKYIYRDPNLRQTLQHFIHPLVVNGLLKFKQEHNSNMLLFAEIPLLFESNFEQYFDLTVTTFCSEESRLRRAKMRVNFDQQIYERISDIQWSQALKIAKANLSIDTDTNLITLESRILHLIEECHRLCEK